ncbi:MAG TPA: response regulator [Spirochaetia bacterium]|nr:response regulator [Spirochaetia bacterium]
MNVSSIPLLLVEDEPDLKEALGEYLEVCGFAVAAAETAEEAFRLAKETPPQVVLSDLSLPDARGDDFLQEFHRAYPSCLLYVHSGDSSFVPSAGLRAAGLTPDHVFPKPSDLGSMVTKFRADLGS